MKRQILALLICVGILISMPFPVIGGGEVFFDSFENASAVPPSGWNRYSANGDISIYNGDASHGSKSVRIIDSSEASSAGLESDRFAVEPNVEYSAMADVYNFSGQCSLYFKYYDNDNNATSKSTTNTDTSGWREMTVSHKAPSNAVSASLILYISQVALGDVLFDNIRVIEGMNTSPPTQTEPINGALIEPVGRELNYNTYNDKGDTLSDFSYAGFYAGKLELPYTESFPVSETLYPSGDPGVDDTERIQTAIDEAAVPEGEMATIKLEAGRYNINSTGIKLKNGIILSGSGQGPNGTVLYANHNEKTNVVNVTGTAPQRVGEKANITDDYINAGSDVIHLSPEDILDFNIGDLVAIEHTATTAWTTAIEMSDLKNTTGGTNNSWTAGKINMVTERTIKSINGTAVTLDFPLYVPYNKSYVQSTIYKIDDTGRIRDFGIENLRLESYYNGEADDEEHSNTAIAMSGAKNGFVRNISAKYFVVSAVRCGANTKQITVQNCSSLQPISQVAGSRRYSFACSTSAQQILFTGCYSYDGRHDYETSFSVTGPVVFSDSVADYSNTASETHGTWSTGILYDNLYQIPSAGKGFFAFANRGYYGTSLSQGWSGAGCVAWNCLSTTVMAHTLPANYQNFLIGVWGRYLDSPSLSSKQSNISSYSSIYRTNSIDNATDARAGDYYKTSDDTPFVGDAYKESPTNPVEPRSLFKAQLAFRVTGNYKNTLPNAPIIEKPRPDTSVAGDSVDITGIYQMDAERVTVYVDDIAYNAQLDAGNYTFSVNVPLEDGWHKIYATQTINGREGAKNADRFIKIGDGEYTDNPSYLESSYSRDKTALITNDFRMRYDEYKYASLDSAISSEHNAYISADEDTFTDINGNEIRAYNCIVFARAREAFGVYERVKCGILISKAPLSAKEFKVSHPAVREYPVVNDPDMQGAFGIRLYGDGIYTGNQYYARAYAVYKIENGKEIFVYADPIIPFSLNII